MNERQLFADVSLPFHVWVKEGRRWVLRDAAQELQERAASARAEPATSKGRSADHRSPR